MKKNKTLLLFAICILIYAVFAVIVITLFNAVQNNPIDKLSITYIRNSPDVQNKYGEIIFIGKNVSYGTKREEAVIKSPYTVETKMGRVIVYVTLMKCDGEWEAISLEVVEVIPDEQ